ncbi:hypothetical protein DESUT3_10400 [Desulfuromonas versatilis]|uniref:Cytochrome P460 domain-containing protein n=1 Tax=Desulfuromonas versatilis TaxID=2802975 RepID=A0ABM8HU09_9BACT|nr:cytochrome P460 family protein [Desulfuromonas versatilis]BCR03971.1 hypothetical protein DESUT3_10400 [Desulfuromonas versatilis]
MPKLSRIIHCLLPLALLVLLGACAKGGSVSEGLPAADGQAVIDYVTRTNPYQGWALWPGKGKLYKGQHPHGAFLTTYISAEVAQAFAAKSTSVPVGGLIVKENYTPDKQLAATTVIYRIKGYNPEGGDWFWLKYAPDGSIEQEGKVEGCINCHAAVQANDWLFTGPIK